MARATRKQDLTAKNKIELTISRRYLCNKNRYREVTAKRKPPPLEVVYNILKKINSKAMPLKAFWLGKTTCFAGGLLL